MASRSLSRNNIQRQIPPRRPLSASTAASTDETKSADSSTPLSASSSSPDAVHDGPTNLPDMDEIVSLCKRRGIIFPSSEIYNGYAGFFDYGPLGAELKKNLKDAWWKHFVMQREDVVGLDSSIIHNPTTWKSSGTFVADDIIHNGYYVFFGVVWFLSMVFILYQDIF